MANKKINHINKKIVMYLLVFSCIFIIPAASVHASSDVIENNNSGIPDKNLYKSILKNLGKKPKEKFTRQEAAGIKKLYIYSGRVKKLKGIGYLKNLQELDLEGAGLKNLKGIQKLTKLKKLNISHNYIKNLKPLKNLKNLKELKANGNNLKSLNGIEKLTKLKRLEAEHNQLEDVKALKNLKDLRIVWLYYNNLTNLKGFGKQKKLKELTLNENKLTGIKELKKLKKLENLDLSNNEIISLAGIEKMKKLENLRANRNKLISIQEVSGLTALKELYVDENQLKNLNGIENLKSLKSIQASSNCLERLADMGQLKNLEWLTVDDNCLASINEVTTLKKLEVLGADYNRITEMPNLSSLSQLKLVCFRFNDLKESAEELKAKLPQAYWNNYGSRFEQDFSYQNADYTIEFTEPAGVEQINLNTTRIAGRIHMPAEKVKIMIEDNINDDDDFSTCYYADVDENGNFIFDHLNFKEYGGIRCDMQIGICYDYDQEKNSYSHTGLRRYRIK